MLTRVEPESTTPTSWVYGTSATLHEIGQLHSVSKPDGYAESYAYDSIGRSQTKTYTEDGTNYQFDYAYNTLGAPDTVTYPNALRVGGVNNNFVSAFPFVTPNQIYKDISTINAARAH
jgi:hypothetical protein